MRATFIQTLTEIAADDPRVLLLTGDLGYMAVEPFAERFPDRFFNVGVAEQNMIGVATGLAEAGFIPFVYSIVTFSVLRPYEFIRNGPIQHRLPVRIVGIGGGIEYGANGLSHYGLEDVGVLRVQPELSIVCPADYQQARSALLATWNLPGPVYYRIGKDDRTFISELEGRYEHGRLQRLRSGSDLLIISMGSAARQAAAAATALSERGVSCELAVCASMAPAPVADIVEGLRRHSLVMAVEAHYRVGGLGSLLCEISADNALGCRVIRCGVASQPDGVSGSEEFLHDRYGISARALTETALRELQIGL